MADVLLNFFENFRAMMGFSTTENEEEILKDLEEVIKSK